MNSSLIISVISLCLCVSGFFFIRWYIARKTAARVLLADYREEVYRLIAEIDAATDRDSLLVEERIKTLRKLIEDTDRRISVYLRELQRGNEGETLYNSLGRGIRIALDSRPPSEPSSQQKTPKPPAPQKIQSPQERPAPAAAAPKETKTSSQSKKRSESKPAAAVKKSTKNDKTQSKKPIQPEKQHIKIQIAEMSSQGHSPQEIASRLGISLAEVDLALNLLQQKRMP